MLTGKRMFPRRFIGPKRRPRVLLVLPALLCFAGATAFAQIRTEVLSPEARPLTPFEVSAVVGENISPRRVELLYRSAVTGDFRTVMMATEPQRLYRASVPATDVVAPGLQFFVRVTDQAGQVHTDPADVAAGLIYQIPVAHLTQPGRPPPISKIDPPPEGIVIGRQPLIEVTLAPEAFPFTPGFFNLTIDGADVTSQVEIEAQRIRLRLASSLNPGLHRAALTFIDLTGQPLEPINWVFTVRDYSGLAETSLNADTTLNVEYSPNKLKEKDPGWKSSINLKVQGRVQEGAFFASSDVNMRWTEQDIARGAAGKDGDLELTNGLITVGYDKTRFEMGDVSVNQSFFTTGPSFARRGLKLTGELFGAQFGLFGVRPAPATGNRHFSGVADTEERVAGASLTVPVIGDQALRIGASVVNGRTESTTAATIGSSAQAGSEGTTYGLQLTSKLFQDKLRTEAEWAMSDANLGIGDQLGKQMDQAARFKLGADAFGFNFGAEYQRLGRDFISLANPALIRDREMATFDVGTRFGPTMWKLAYTWSHDNVRNDHDLPQATQTGPSLTFGLFVPDYPIVNLTYARSQQRSQHIPAGSTGIAFDTDIVGASIAYGQPTWSVSFAPSFSIQDDRESAADTNNLNLALGLGFRPTPYLNISPTYALSRQVNRQTNNIIFTHVPTLTARVEFIPQTLIFDTQALYNITRDTDGTVNNRIFTGLLRLSWHLKRLIGSEHLAPALSLRYNYNRTTDFISSTNRREEHGVFLIFDLYVKTPLLPSTWLDRLWPRKNGPAPGIGASGPGPQRP